MPGTSAPGAGAADGPQRTAGHATAGTGVNGQPDGGWAGAAAEPDPRRWLVLAVIAVAQLMVVLDATVMNIALPSAQRDLGFSNVDRQWVVTAYALPFGSLLLFGGRLADLIGRRAMFITGLAGFAAASAVSFPMLVTARACQGARLPRSRRSAAHRIRGLAVPREVAKVLTRSAGAVANALDKLVSLGVAQMVTDKPRTYQAREHPADGDLVRDTGLSPID